MTVVTAYLEFSTQGNTDIIDITGPVQQKLQSSKLKDGIATISVIGSTGGLTTCEFESGLVQDLKDYFQKHIPAGEYHHDRAWGDGNGHSHLRASLLGPSLTVPFSQAKLILGTWQQIIFIDFDVRPRKRKIVVQLMGE